MAFENLSERLQAIFKNLTSQGKLSEKDVQIALREVKLALLEADVNFKVVKRFMEQVQLKAIGEELAKSITPGQQVIKIVHQELIHIMGSTQSKLTFSSVSPTVFMVVGLQGSGKTTFSAKLAKKLKEEKKNPMLVACDLYRPAAVKQLQVLGQTIAVPVYTEETEKNPIQLANHALAQAKKSGHDVVIIDTAGRLHIDETLMCELKTMKQETNPHEIFMVIDAMTGQDAVNIADTFNQSLGIDAIVLSKLDGDARGGAALSVREITEKPIKYISNGEKLNDLEEFHPDRMASRILGMGDVLSLIEKAESAFDEEQTRKLESKMLKNEFDLEDFLLQMQQIKKMGPLSQIVSMIPGMSQINLEEAGVNEKSMKHVEAIIQSMTMEERKKPTILNGSRKKRIANGSGRNIQEVNRLLKQFEEMKKMMKQFGSMSKKKKSMFGKFQNPFQ